MATDTGPETIESVDPGLGRVSRLRGALFRYVTFVASLVGVVSLGVLLAYVFWDALGMDSAQPGWYAGFFLLVVAPFVGFVLRARTDAVAGEVALELFATVAGGIQGGFALVVVLDVIAGVDVWLSYFLTTIGPAVGVYLYGRLNRAASWTGLGVLAAGLLGPVAGTLLIGRIDAVVSGVGAPGIYLLTVTLPAALGVGLLVDRNEDLGDGRPATLALFALGVAGIVGADAVPGVSRSVWQLFVASVAAPTGYVVAKNLADRERWSGLAGPGALVVGAGVLLLVDGPLGLVGPSPWFDWQFLTSPPGLTDPSTAGVYAPIIGSVFVIVLVAIFTLFLGVGAALYLEEYAGSSGLRGAVARLVRINISNLAGVPSVVYGLLGLAVFARLIGTGIGTVLTAALTLSLLILPIVIISAREAIAAVPDSQRRASYGMGATRWQTVRNVVLPRSLPGIMTGTILALGRAIGETAPLLMIGVPAFRRDEPTGLFTRTGALPRQVFTWADNPNPEFQYGVLAAGVVTLLVVLLTMNSIAILIRNKYERGDV